MKDFEYIQKYIEINPEASFLEKTVEWGIIESGQSGGLRMFSPFKYNEDVIFDDVVSTIEKQFKVGFNIFSSSGTYSSDNDGNVQVKNGLLGDIAGPQQSLFSLEQARQISPQWEEIIADVDCLLVYHVYYKNARDVILNHDMKYEDYSTVWTYAALLHQDTEVLNKVYPIFQQVFTTLPEESQKIVSSSILKSISDAEQLNKLFNLENNTELNQTLREVGLLEDMKPFMSKRELDTYFPSTTKKMKK